MSRLSAEPDEIVFEDLHGVTDEESGTLEIDLDAKDDTGITRRARTSTDEGTPTGDEDFDAIDYGSGKTPRADDGDDGNKGDEDTQPRDKFSKKFEDRLERERRAKRREAKARADAEAENARLRAQLKKAKSSGGSDKIADLDRQVADIEAQLEQAIEKGETKEHVRLTSQLTDLKAEKIAARYTADDDSDDDLGEPAARTSASPRNELVGEWKDTHSDWYGRGGFERQTRLANRIDREVFADGYSPDDEEYYEELNRRLQEKMPEMFDDDSGSVSRDERGQRRAKRDKGRSPVAAADDASRDSAPRKPTGNKVELGPVEFANMRRFGLDPKNPAHVKEYALNKRQADAEEAANG